MKKLIIQISPDGSIKSRTENIKWKQCMKYMSIVDNLTEARIVDSEFTSEYNETEITETQNVLLEERYE